MFYCTRPCSSLAIKVFTVSVFVITLLSELCIFLLSSFNNSKISDKYVNDSPKKNHFQYFFYFFEKTTYYCRARRLSVRPSVVCGNIFFFCVNSLPSKPIDLKIGLNVREGVVHVRKARFFEILIASGKFMQFPSFCKINLCAQF